MSPLNRRFGLVVLGALMVALAMPAIALGVPTYASQFGLGGGAGDGQFNTPSGLAADGLGRVYVADYGNLRMEFLNQPGAFGGKWTADGVSTLNRPSAVAVDRFGQVIVCDSGRSRVTEYTKDGVFIRAIGTGGISGTGNGEFATPWGVATDRFGFIYVVDTWNHRVQKFYPDGTFHSKWGVLGTEPGEFDRPCGIGIDALGNVYVTEFGNHRVQKFDASGKFVTQWGGYGSDEGKLNYPGGLAVGQDGNIYVTEYFNTRVSVFSPSGQYLYKFGSSGSGNGEFTGVWGIATDGLGIYVSDQNSMRIQKFSLSTPKAATRVGGSDRYEVAINLAAKRWPGFVGIKDVIVVCGEDRANADPLASAGLASIYDAPVLMTKSGSLNPSTKSALTQIRSINGPLNIHVIGGTRSIPKAVHNAIAKVNSGGTIERINGADRYELSANMAVRLKQVADSKGIKVPGVLLFNGQNSAAFYDALAASPLSAGGQAPMLALRNTSVPGPVLNVLNGALAGKPRYVVNSTTYVPASLYTAAGATRRLSSSANRAASAAQIASAGRSLGWVRLENISVANKLPDALTGGSYIGEQGGVLLYTDKASLPTDTAATVAAFKTGSLQGWVFGGPASVTDSAIAQFATALNTP